jgi:glutathione S-transferase
VLEDGARKLIESGAIIDYLLRHHGQGRLQPPAGSEAYEDYQQWLHYAEGSAMLPLMLKLYVSRLGDAGAPLWPRIESELSNHLGYVARSLQGKAYLMGDELTGADVQMSFVGVAAGARGNRAAYPNIEAWVKRFQARPAYRKAIELGGPYSFAS